MRKILWPLAIILGIPAALMLRGMHLMSEANDDDPLTESQPERIAHRDAVYDKCIGHSKAAPDKLYCKRMADLTISYYTDWGMFQEGLFFGTDGLVPRWFHVPTSLEEMQVRLQAEQYAKRRGPDGSTRFTGAKVPEYDAALQEMYGDSEVFGSRRQNCDPEGETMKAIMKDSPGKTAEELHEGMDCKDWNK